MRASSGAWLGEVVEDDVAELLGASVSLGVAGGRGNDGRRRQLPPGMRGTVHRRGRARERVRGGRGGCMACAEASRAAGTQAGRELVWRAKRTRASGTRHVRLVGGRRRLAQASGLGRAGPGQVSAR